MHSQRQRETRDEMISLSDVIIQLIDRADGSTLDELITGVLEEWGDCHPRIVGIALRVMRRKGRVYRRGGRYYVRGTR